MAGYLGTTGLTSVNTNLPLAVRVNIQMSGNNSAPAGGNSRPD